MDVTTKVLTPNGIVTMLGNLSKVQQNNSNNNIYIISCGLYVIIRVERSGWVTVRQVSGRD